MVLSEQKLRGVGYLPETILLHLINAEFRGAPEPVLHASQDTVHIVLVALELNDGVDDMFQNLRSCEGALLGDMSDEDDWHTACLGEAEEGRGTFTNLGDGTSR